MGTILFILVYIFSIIGYFGIGLFVYISFDTSDSNKLVIYFNNMLKNIFYKFNKEKCYLKDGILFYEFAEYYESSIWDKNYEPFNTIFELLSIILWPIWILINLIIGAFYDD